MLSEHIAVVPCFLKEPLKSVFSLLKMCLSLSKQIKLFLFFGSPWLSGTPIVDQADLEHTITRLPVLDLMTYHQAQKKLYSFVKFWHSRTWGNVSVDKVPAVCTWEPKFRSTVPMERPGWALYVYDPVLWEAEQGFSWHSLASQPSHVDELSAQWETLSQIIMCRATEQDTVVFGLQMHVHPHKRLDMCTHINTWTCPDKHKHTQLVFWRSCSSVQGVYCRSCSTYKKYNPRALLVGLSC